MAASPAIRLTREQKSEGYSITRNAEYVLVWHNKSQIALLLAGHDINRKVQAIVEKRRQELKDIEIKTGWKP